MIVESYYLRPLAKELLKGVADPVILGIIPKILPPPDLILDLDVPASVAYSRNGNSLSLHEVRSALTFEDYALFQESVSTLALRLADDIEVIRIDGCKLSSEILSDVLGVLAISKS